METVKEDHLENAVCMAAITKSLMFSLGSDDNALKMRINSYVLFNLTKLDNNNYGNKHS
jgi:hypothetical protein